MINIYKVQNNSLLQIDDILKIDAKNDVFWVDLVSPTLEEDKQIEDYLKISIPTRQDMQEIELSSQFYEEGGINYMTLFAVAQINLDDPVKTPVTFILTSNVLVSIRYETLTSFTQYIQRAQKSGGVSIVLPEAMMFDILESLINRIADSLEIVGADIDAISRDIFRTKKYHQPAKTVFCNHPFEKLV